MNMYDTYLPENDDIDYSKVIFEWLCGLDEDLLENLRSEYGLPEADCGEIHNEIVNCEDLKEFCIKHYLD